jgi:hypothetical protein
MEKCCKATRIIAFLNWSILTSAFVLPLWAHAFPGHFAVGPDSNQEMLISSINSAQRELLINIYQMDTPAVVRAIIDKINQGLSVSLLVEASPVGGVGAAETAALNAIQNAMNAQNNGNQHLFMMGKQRRSDQRRFRFDHAKYIVIDSNRVYVTSENFTTTGHADSGTVGNRGWDAVLDSPSLAQELIEIFQSDVDPQYGDIYEYQSTGSLEPNSHESSGSARSLVRYGVKGGNVGRVTLVTSPNSLDGIINVIRSARQKIRMEEMSLPLTWKTPETVQDPIVTELIRAAERGVRVQVLLNDEQVFHHGSHRDDDAPLRGNDQTVDFLQSYAKSNRLPLEARIIDIRATQITYVHNKGIIVDDQAVFVSSINGTQNSVMNNREVAVLLESSDAANYFTPVFDFDWAQSGEGSEEIPQSENALNWFGRFLFSLNPQIGF